MDVYSRYHQVHMAKEDESKTRFNTPKMDTLLSLSEVWPQKCWATFQRLKNLVLDGQVGRNVEVYVDNIIVKIHLSQSHPEDLAGTFNNLHKFGVKLNPDTCLWGRGGELLGFMAKYGAFPFNLGFAEAMDFSCLLVQGLSVGS